MWAGFETVEEAAGNGWKEREELISEREVREERVSPRWALAVSRCAWKTGEGKTGESLWTSVGFALSDLEPEDNRVESGCLKGSLAQERAGLKESRNIARGICR